MDELKKEESYQERKKFREWKYGCRNFFLKDWEKKKKKKRKVERKTKKCLEMRKMIARKMRRKKELFLEAITRNNNFAEQK